MSRAISLLIATLVAAVVIGLAAPSFASRAETRLRSSIPFLQSGSSVSCRSIASDLIQFDATLDAGLSPGRVTVLDDGTLAVLIVAADVDETGRPVAVDFAASLRIAAIVIQSSAGADTREFDPAVRNGANLRAANDAAIERVTFCYRVSFPAPPKAHDPNATAEPETTPTVEPTATELVLDTSARETAAAQSAEIVATATAAAERAATEIAAAETQAAQIAASATVAADSARATVEAQQTAIAAAETEAAAAEETVTALQATLSAPTATPEPQPTPPPAATAVAYQTSGDEPFAGWSVSEGWSADDALLVTDGEGSSSWLVVPAPATIGSDVAIEVEFRVTGGELCPRNFGVGLRMSEAGYQAGGIEWACAPEAILWSGGAPLSKSSLPDGLDLNDGWHTMRVATIGDRITIAFDGVEVASEEISAPSDGRLIAIWSDNVALEIRAVTVAEVSP